MRIGPHWHLVVGLLLASSMTVPAAGQTELFLLVPERSELEVSPTRRTLRRLHLGQQRWLLGRRVLPVAMPAGSPARQAFNRRVLRMTEDELAAYWIGQALLGAALPPLEVEGLDAMCGVLRRSPGALGYALLESTKTPELRGVRILPLPDP